MYGTTESVLLSDPPSSYHAAGVPPGSPDVRFFRAMTFEFGRFVPAGFVANGKGCSGAVGSYVA
jgi:hypothetical protein